MRGLLLLSLRHLLFHRGRTAILIACLAVPIFLPLTTETLFARYETSLMQRANATPLLLGSKGNRFDLTLAALYYRAAELSPIIWADLERVQSSGLAIGIPLRTVHTARHYPLIGTSLDYFDYRGLRLAEGRKPQRLGDVVLGAAVAEDLDLHPGDAIFSDPRDLYDISKPPALKMRITGVLAHSGSPEDRAVLTGIKTTWVIDGIGHGHQAADKLPSKVLFGKTRTKDGGEDVRVNPAVYQYNEITDANIGSFHFHGDLAKLPLSAVIAVPPDRKSATILKTRLNAEKTLQMVVPSEVIEDLLSIVFKIKQLLLTLSTVLALCMAAMTALILLLTTKLREREMRTLENIGASRLAVLSLHGIELVGILLISVLVAIALQQGCLLFLPNLVTAL